MQPRPTASRRVRSPTSQRGNQSLVWHDVPNICVWPPQSLLAEEVLRVGGRAERLHVRRRDLSIRAALLAQPPNPRIACELWVNFPTID
jgi:hypothetical protein